MLAAPLDNTYDQTMSWVACPHGPSVADTVGRRRAWHSIISLRKHTLSHYVSRGMTSSPLQCILGWIMSRVACLMSLGHHTQIDDIRRRMTAWSLGGTYGQTTLIVACHYFPLTARMIGLCWAWLAIITIGQHTQSDNFGFEMQPPPLESIHG